VTAVLQIGAEGQALDLFGERRTDQPEGGIEQVDEEMVRR